VETRFSISHSKAVFRQTEHEVTHIQLRVDTNLGPAAITCGIAWNLLSDPLHPDTAIRKLMGYQPCPKRNHCYRYVVSLPDPATLGLQLATLEYFGEPKKTISRGLQVDLLVEGRRSAISRVAKRITNQGDLDPLMQHLLATARNAYGGL
jgi:hypothetical protein